MLSKYSSLSLQLTILLVTFSATSIGDINKSIKQALADSPAVPLKVRVFNFPGDYVIDRSE